MVPEPFSITIGVFATLGFLKLARQGYEALNKDFKAYSAAAETIRRILADADRAEWQIQLWKRIWSIEIDTHEEFPEFLWEDGWEHIRSQIDKIEKVARDVEKIILPLRREYDLAGFGENLSGLNHSRALEAAEVQRLAQQKFALKQINSKLWWGKKVSLVMSKSEALEKLLAQLPVLLDHLHNICERTYFDLHGQSKNIPDRERRETATMKMLVSQAIKTREASGALHQCCHSMEDCGMELELSLLRWKLGIDTPRPFSAGIPERLCYYLIFPSETVASIIKNPNSTSKDAVEFQSPSSSDLEVLVEKKLNPKGACKQDFREVLTELCQGESCYLRTPLEDHGMDVVSVTTSRNHGEAASSVIFQFSNACDPLKGFGREDSRLRRLLTRPATKADGSDLSFRERIEVAYRLVKCGLLLLGTSWLSSLDTSNITRVDASGKETRYRLFVGPRIGESAGHHDLQTHRVGQVLRELALGSNIGDYDAKIDLSLVSTEFGPQYKRAIEFCYDPRIPDGMSSVNTRKDFEPFHQAILTGFFQEVVYPLAKLHQANVSLWDLGQVPEPSKNREGLSFLPKTYADPPVQPFGGLIPTLSTSLESPVNFLSMFRSTIKALSVRSGSKLGNLGKTKAIVYHVSTQKFVILAKNDIPPDARRLEIPENGMSHDIYLPSQNPAEEKKLLCTVRFDELGRSVLRRRLRGKISELYIVDNLSGGLEDWGIEAEQVIY